MSAQPSWDPAAYARFGDQRSRPFADLLAQVRADDPTLVVDLGCGHGPATLTLAQLWPEARIVGVDAAESMLEAARTLDTEERVEWVQADLGEWDPASLGQVPDVIITNSTLQWVPSHLNLLPTWVDALAPGGWLALQVPNNFDAPSHALMRATAATHAASTRPSSASRRAIVSESAASTNGTSSPQPSVTASTAPTTPSRSSSRTASGLMYSEHALSRGKAARSTAATR